MLPTKVMLVDNETDRAQWLRDALLDAGFNVVATIQGLDDLYQQVLDLEPDVVIVEATSGKRDILEHLANHHQRCPRPIVMLADEHDAEAIREAASAGVSAYAVAGVSAAGVKSIIDVAVAQFEAYCRLERRLATAENRLDDQKLIERAKCLMMERHAISERDAYGLLRKAAMDRSKKVREIAAAYLRANGKAS